MAAKCAAEAAREESWQAKSLDESGDAFTIEGFLDLYLTEPHECHLCFHSVAYIAQIVAHPPMERR